MIYNTYLIPLLSYPINPGRWYFSSIFIEVSHMSSTVGMWSACWQSTLFTAHANLLSEIMQLFSWEPHFCQIKNRSYIYKLLIEVVMTPVTPMFWLGCSRYPTLHKWHMVAVLFEKAYTARHSMSGVWL